MRRLACVLLNIQMMLTWMLQIVFIINLISMGNLFCSFLLVYTSTQEIAFRYLHTFSSGDFSQLR